MANSPDQPSKKPSKLKKVLRQLAPLGLAGVLSGVGHSVIDKNVRDTVGDTVSATGSKVGSVLSSLAPGRDPLVELEEFKTKVSPQLFQKLQLDYLRSQKDKQQAHDLVQERAAEGQKFLKKIREEYSTMDPKEMVWKLEYFFQGPTNEKFDKAQGVLRQELAPLRFSNTVNPNVTDLALFHGAFVPQGPRDDIKSSAVDFLASPMNPEFENCDAASKTLVLAILSKYPKLRNSLSYQFFDKHVRLVVDLQGQKHIFEWEEVRKFPDTITNKSRNALIPVDVYYALSAGRRDKELLNRIQYFGPKPEEKGPHIPSFTNTNIPQFAIPEKLGEYRSIKEETKNAEELEELKKAKTELEREKIKLKREVNLILPAVTDDEKRRLKIFTEHKAFDSTIGMNGMMSPPPVLIKMDQIKLQEIKTIIEQGPIRVAKIIFTGLKKMTPEVFEFIIENFEHNELAFDDLEEIEGKQLAKLFEILKEGDKYKTISFYSLKSVTGKKEIKLQEELYEMDLRDLVIDPNSTLPLNIPKPSEKPSEIRYKKINLTFHALSDMSHEAAKWLAKQKGDVTFGSETNLPSPISREFEGFQGKLKIQNGHAVSLVQGVKNREKPLYYNAGGHNEGMVKALGEYHGEIIGEPPLEWHVFDKGHNQLSENQKNHRKGFFKTMGKKSGPVTLEIDRFNPGESALLKGHPGEMKIGIRNTSTTKQDLENIASNQGKLIVTAMPSPIWSTTGSDQMKSRTEQTVFMNDRDESILGYIDGFKAAVSFRYFSNGNAGLQALFSKEKIKELGTKNAFVTVKINDLYTPEKCDKVIKQLNGVVPNVIFEKEADSEAE